MLAGGVAIRPAGVLGPPSPLVSLDTGARSSTARRASGFRRSLRLTKTTPHWRSEVSVCT